MKHWEDYRVERWPVKNIIGQTIYRYNPQYWEDGKWRPYTVGRQPRLYHTRMEAEQWIEVQLIVAKRKEKK